MVGTEATGEGLFNEFRLEDQSMIFYSDSVWRWSSDHLLGEFIPI